MMAMPDVRPSWLVERLVTTLKISTAASSRNCTTSGSRAKPAPRRCEACAISHTTVTASIPTGMASACAKLNGPPMHRGG